jgi:hypothetical protein
MLSAFSFRYFPGVTGGGTGAGAGAVGVSVSTTKFLSVLNSAEIPPTWCEAHHKPKAARPIIKIATGEILTRTDGSAIKPTPTAAQTAEVVALPTISSRGG